MKPRSFPEIIKADTVFLKRHEMSIANQMFEQVIKDRKRLGRFLPWVGWTRELEDIYNYIFRVDQQWTDLKTFDYGIFRSSDQVYLGHAGVHSICWQHQHLELGYFIWRDFEGHGYATQALRALEITAFNWGFHRLELRCDPSNTRSVAVAERNLYIREGLLRQNTLIGKKRCDTLIFSKLRNS